MSMRAWPRGMQVAFEVQQCVNSSAKKSHLVSKAQRISADDRHGIDLAHWIMLACSSGVGLWDLCVLKADL